jgi:hypothetical protein
MEINRLPIRIISWVKCSAILIELIAENEIPCVPVAASLRVGLLVSVRIDERGEIGQFGYLA